MNWINSVPQTAATTMVHPPIFPPLPWNLLEDVSGEEEENKIFAFKGIVSRDFCPRFFMVLTHLGPVIHMLKYFRIWLQIPGNIHCYHGVRLRGMCMSPRISNILCINFQSFFLFSLCIELQCFEGTVLVGFLKILKFIGEDYCTGTTKIKF